MNIVHAILGAVILFFGRRLYWLAVGVLGFLVGAQLASQQLAETEVVIQLLAAVAAGVIGAILAIVFQRIAFAVGGILAGAYLAQGIAVSVGANPDAQLIWSAIGGVGGAVIAVLLMDWAIIALTSLVGAGAIVSTIELSDGVSALLLVVLAALGIAVQAWHFGPSQASERHPTHGRSRTSH